MEREAEGCLSFFPKCQTYIIFQTWDAYTDAHQKQFHVRYSALLDVTLPFPLLFYLLKLLVTAPQIEFVILEWLTVVSLRNPEVEVMGIEERMGSGDLSSGEGKDPEGRLGFPWGGISSVILVGKKEMKVGGGTGKYAGFLAES